MYAYLHVKAAVLSFQ